MLPFRIRTIVNATSPKAHSTISYTHTFKGTEYRCTNNTVNTSGKARHNATTTTIQQYVDYRELFRFRNKYLDQTRHQTESKWSKDYRLTGDLII